MLGAVESYKRQFEALARAVEAHPLCEVVQPLTFGAALERAAIDNFADVFSGLVVPEEVRRFYQVMDGASFFWRARSAIPEATMSAYNAGSHPTCMDWERTNGFSIVGIAELLTAPAFTDLRVTERSPEILATVAGPGVSSETMGQSVRPFDRHLRHDNEDGCVALLMLPDVEARVVGITDSGTIDPKRPWMRLTDYLDYMIAMCGDQGGRYEFSGLGDLSSGQLRFDAESLTSFRNGILRPLP